MKCLAPRHTVRYTPPALRACHSLRTHSGRGILIMLHCIMALQWEDGYGCAAQDRIIRLIDSADR